MWLLRFALLLGSGDALLAPAAARRLPTRMSLAGSTYRINLDFGRETGTWMPPRWAATSGRTEFTLDLAFEDDGVATVASLARPLRGGGKVEAGSRGRDSRACSLQRMVRRFVHLRVGVK